MKNLTNKQKVIAISILIVLFCIGFLLGLFTGLGRRNRENKEIEIAKFAMDSEIINNTEENVNNKVTTIDIESFFDVDRSVQQKFTLNQEEIYEIFDIIDNLKFSKETCDGLPSFYIKYNSKEKDGFITYGLETFNNEYHITSAEKGEAVLTQEQRVRLDKIINKYFKFLTMQVQE